MQTHRNDTTQTVFEAIADALAEELISTVRVTKTESGWTVKDAHDWNPEVLYYDDQNVMGDPVDWEGIGADYRHVFETYESIGSATDGGAKYIEWHLGDVLSDLEVGEVLLVRQGVIDAQTGTDAPEGDYDSEPVGWFIAADILKVDTDTEGGTK